MDELAALARGEGWTEERHAAFLDRMELSFVQQVLLGRGDVRQASRSQAEGGRGQQDVLPAPAPALLLPLDRPLPDSAVESNRPAARRRAPNVDARRAVHPAVGVHSIT
ncbi:hypothetical protein U9M48_022439 [Paspalum notatum var. saurae]|uniref:Uncharacterized protein n=1 Tax=Paspalum notatum var. saurae TaxID=547442 RepID=A0AAQ3TLV3_PASNO